MKSGLYLSALVFGGALLSWAGAPPAGLSKLDRKAPNSGVMLVDARNGEKASVVNALRKFIESDLRLRTEVSTVGPVKKMSEAVGSVGQSGSMKTEFSVVLCTLPKASLKQSLLILPDQQKAIINVMPLQTKDTAQLERRIKRQLSRSLALLAGVGFNPNPRCCMQPIGSMKHFDSISYNMSPPARMAFERAMRAKGIQLIGDKERMEAMRKAAQQKKKNMDKDPAAKE